MKLTQAQILLGEHLGELGLEHAFEYQFYDRRKFRFDIALTYNRIGIEINGGAWSRGRHTRGGGYIKDMEKFNIAAIQGWRIFQFTPQQVMKGEAKAFIEQWTREPDRDPRKDED